jgi:hypothetical protein
MRFTGRVVVVLAQESHAHQATKSLPGPFAAPHDLLELQLGQILLYLLIDVLQAPLMIPGYVS